MQGPRRLRSATLSTTVSPSAERNISRYLLYHLMVSHPSSFLHPEICHDPISILLSSTKIFIPAMCSPLVHNRPPISSSCSHTVLEGIPDWMGHPAHIFSCYTTTTAPHGWIPNTAYITRQKFSSVLCTDSSIEHLSIGKTALKKMMVVSDLNGVPTDCSFSHLAHASSPHNLPKRR